MKKKFADLICITLKMLYTTTPDIKIPLHIHNTPIMHKTPSKRKFTLRQIDKWRDQMTNYILNLRNKK